MAREYTNKVLDLMYDGVLDPTWLANALASWMSEADMHEFYNTYLLDSSEEGEYDE